MSQFLQKFLKHFMIGGIGISVLGLLIEFSKFGVAYSSYLYAALPTVYFYLFWLTYKVHGEKGISNLNIHILIGTSLFISFVVLTQIMNKVGIDKITSLIVGTIFFMLMSYMYYTTIMRKRFN